MSEAQTGSNTASNEAIADYIRQYRLQKRKCDEENGVLRSLLKSAKSHGIKPAAIKAAVLATKVEPEEAISDLRDTIRYMGLARVPLQRDDFLDVFDFTVNTATERADDLWEIGERAYRAGRDGASSDDCPYQEDTEFRAHWLTEWQKGVASKQRELGPNTEQAIATRKKPGRKPRQSAMDIDAAQPPQAAAEAPDDDDYRPGEPMTTAADQPDEPVEVFEPRRRRSVRRTAAALN